MTQYDVDVQIGDRVKVVEVHPAGSLYQVGHVFTVDRVSAGLAPADSQFAGWAFINWWAVRVRVLERDGKAVERCASCLGILGRVGYLFCVKCELGEVDNSPQQDSGGNKSNRPERGPRSRYLRDVTGEWPEQASGTPAAPGEPERTKCTGCGAPATRTIVETCRDTGEQREVLGACVYCSHRWEGVEPCDDPAKSSQLDWVDEPQPEVSESAWQTATSEGP